MSSFGTVFSLYYIGTVKKPKKEHYNVQKPNEKTKKQEGELPC